MIFMNPGLFEFHLSIRRAMKILRFKFVTKSSKMIGAPSNIEKVDTSSNLQSTTLPKQISIENFCQQIISKLSETDLIFQKLIQLLSDIREKQNEIHGVLTELSKQEDLAIRQQVLMAIKSLSASAGKIGVYIGDLIEHLPHCKTEEIE